jgi:hypothetical protein
MKALAGRERDATAQLVASLAELDARTLRTVVSPPPVRRGSGPSFSIC